MTYFWESTHSNGFLISICLLISVYFFLLTSSQKWEIKDRFPFALYFLLFALWSGLSLYDTRNTYTQNLFTLVFFIAISSVKFLISFAVSIKNDRNLAQLAALLLVMPVLTIVLYHQSTNQDPWNLFFITSDAVKFSGGWLIVIFVYVLSAMLFSFLALIKSLFPSSSRIVTYYWGIHHATLPTVWLLAIENRNIIFLNVMPIDIIYPVEVLSFFFVALAVSIRFIHNDVNRVDIIESMPNGWILLDEEDKIVDLNLEAANILGTTKKLALNLSFKRFDLDIPLSTNDQNSPVSLNLKKSFRKRDELRYYNVQIRTVMPDASRKWRLLFWTDTTYQKISENSRQAARDEMFVLLNAVSSEASHSASLSEFLDGAIYQLIFSFRTQAAIVYLLSNIETGMSFEPKIYKPMSVFGVPQDALISIQ